MMVNKFNCEIIQYLRKLYSGSMCDRLQASGVVDFKIDLDINLDGINKFDKEIKHLLLELVDKLKNSENSKLVIRGVS